jgi:hypothetical protein
MFDQTNKKPQRPRMREQFHNEIYGKTDLPAKAYTPEQIMDMLENQPYLRLNDNPAHRQLAMMVMADPQDMDLQDAFQTVVGFQRQAAAQSQDVFWGNYPTPGTVTYPADFVQVGVMPTGDPAGFAMSQARYNIVFAGPSGRGKTTCLKGVLCDSRLFKTTRIVVFGKKSELRGLLELYPTQGYVTVFMMDELQLAYCQPPPGVSELYWANELSRLTGQVYGRFTAQRLMNDALHELLTHRPADAYPTLAQMITAIELQKTHPFSRQGQYKDSILNCLKDLQYSTGKIWNYGSSNFLEVLFATPGLAIIEVSTLAQEHLNFLATYFIRWIYSKRLIEMAKSC